MAITSAEVSYRCFPTNLQVDVKIYATLGDLVFVEIWKGGVKIRDTSFNTIAAPHTYSTTGLDFSTNDSYDVRVYNPDHLTNYGAIITTACVFTPPCDAVISSISVVNDVNAQNVGSLTVNASTSSGPLQYSIGGVVYQAGNVFTGLSAGSYNVFVKDALNCTAFKKATIVNTSCSLSINSSSKTDETGVAANNGTINIAATSGAGGIQYSLNGGPYQSSGSFTSLPPGVHTVYIKDAANCTTSQNFTINEYVLQVPEECFDPDLRFPPLLPYKIKIIKCNPNEFIEDNDLYNETEICGIHKDCFYQILSCDDVLTLSIYYDDPDWNTIPLLSIVDYFTGTTIQQYNFVSLGFGYYSLEQPVNEIPNICEKVVYLRFDSYNGDDVSYYQFGQSEPIHISNRHDCTVLLEYWNESDWLNVRYNGTGYVNHMRIPAQFWKDAYPQDKDVYRKSNGELVKLREEISKKIKLEVGYLPSYMHEKIALALSHDHVRINGVEYVCEEDYKADEPDGRYALSRGEAELTHKTYLKKNLIK